MLSIVVIYTFVAGEDYTALSVDFEPINGRQCFTIPTTDNQIADGAKDFTVTLSGQNPLTQFVNHSVRVVIMDNDGKSAYREGAVSFLYGDIYGNVSHLERQIKLWH